MGSRLDCIVGLLIVGSSATMNSVAGETEDIVKLFGDEQTIRLALGYDKSLRQVPAIASVITGEDLKHIGVRTLAQALETVPGVHVIRGRGTNRFLSIRGLFSDLGPYVLLKRNGVPISQGQLLNLNPYDLLPVNAIQRVEIIRGPNSATDGAEALAGAVNIVTKPSAGFIGTEVGSRAGINDTYDGWINHGSVIGPLQVGFSLSGWTTDGTNQLLETDTQSQFDHQTGRKTSLAPGPLNTENEGAEMELDLATRAWRLRLGYFGVTRNAVGAGAAQVLDPQGNVEHHFANADLVYHDVITPELEVEALFSYLFRNQHLKETFLHPNGLPAFPDGVTGEIENDTQVFRGETSAIWSGIREHTFRLTTGAYSVSIDDIEQRANARSVRLPSGQLVNVPLGEFRELTPDEQAIPENSQTTSFGGVLDEWRIADSWTLTSGLRFDYFTDVGLSVAPRLALVWDPGYRTTVKWLYGRGIRPPAFLERLARPNQGIVVGNPDLEPEKVDTVEFQVKHWGERYQWGVNLFGYRLTDPIVATGERRALSLRNSGSETGYGLEAEAEYALTPRLSLKGNYAFSDSLEPPASSIGSAPRHLIYGETRWEVLPETFFDVNVKAVLERERARNDPRPAIDDYVTVNLAVQRENLLDGVGLGVVVRNLLDTDARDGSVDNGLSASTVPLADIPLDGRELWAELHIAF